MFLAYIPRCIRVYDTIRLILCHAVKLSSSMLIEYCIYIYIFFKLPFTILTSSQAYLVKYELRSSQVDINMINNVTSQLKRILSYSVQIVFLKICSYLFAFQLLPPYLLQKYLSETLIFRSLIFLNKSAL